MQDGVEKDEVGLISVYLGSLTISPGGEDRLYLQDGWADVLIMQDGGEGRGMFYLRISCLSIFLSFFFIIFILVSRVSLIL